MLRVVGGRCFSARQGLVWPYETGIMQGAFGKTGASYIRIAHLMIFNSLIDAEEYVDKTGVILIPRAFHAREVSTLLSPSLPHCTASCWRGRCPRGAYFKYSSSSHKLSSTPGTMNWLRARGHTRNGAQRPARLFEQPIVFH